MNVSDIHKKHCELKTYLETQKEYAAELLSELIRCPSVQGEEMGAMTEIRKAYEDCGFDTEIVKVDESFRSHPEFTNLENDIPYEGRGNLVVNYGRGKTSAKERSLIINSHIDVIPAEKWSKGFIPKRENDIIYGRGACDDKGSAVAAFLVLRTLKELQIPLTGILQTQTVIDEETGGNGTLSLLTQGYTADAAVVMEGSNLEIKPSNRGAIWFKIVTQGLPVHMGKIDKGVSAIDKTFDIIRILKNYEQHLLKNFGKHHYFKGVKRPIQMCVGMIKGGEWPSMVPSEVTIEGGIGFLPNKTKQKIAHEVKEWIDREADDWTREHYTITHNKLHNAAFETPPDHPFVEIMRESAKVCGISDDIKGWSVSCDARLFKTVADMPVIVFGPGKIEDAHSNHENIDLNDILKAAEMLAVLSVIWCGSED